MNLADDVVVLAEETSEIQEIIMKMIKDEMT